MSFLNLLIITLAFLALPVVLVVLYDKFTLAPQRAKKPDGEPEPGPTYVRVANVLLPFVLVAVVKQIGIAEVFAWAKQISIPLSWLALPVGLWCAIDSWIFAPHRLVAKGAVSVKDPPLLRALYAVLPLLVIAVIVRLISAESLDFSLVLLLLSVATGLVWLIDEKVFRKRRLQAMQKGVGGEMQMPEPGTVDYARSFFPVAFIVLIVRAFIFEPFRIPSDSMMPTLLDGDFIVVSKYSYGLRLPVLNTKFIETGTPQRGDVVVFRYPPNPSVNYIKRLVGLPGDRVEVRNDHLIINGEMVQLEDKGLFADDCYFGLHLLQEKLGEHTHNVMSCHSPNGLTASHNLEFTGHQNPTPSCDRKQVVQEIGGWVCRESPDPGMQDSGDHVFDVVPAGHYLMIGDNRDNSEDGRRWGFVPDENLVGKATRIWLNFDPARTGFINAGRIGDSIE